MNKITCTIALLSALAAVGCSDDKDDKTGSNSELSEAEKDFVAKIESCDFLEGEVAALLDNNETPSTDEGIAAEACAFQCVQDATCADLANWYCEEGELQDDGTLVQCTLGCYGATVYTCPANPDSGEETADISAFNVCNGIEECADGRDEVGCESSLFTCDDDSKIEMLAVCDGFADCEDESDEDDCEGKVFTCMLEGETETYPNSYKCDLYKDCDDGSDEVGCDVQCIETTT